MERLKSHRDFVAVLKRRRTITDKDIVLHLLVPDNVTGENAQQQLVEGQAGRGSVSMTHRRLGLAVSKSVGNAVTRNLVKRRFRVLAKRFENTLPPQCDVILRAKPSAARAPFSLLEPQIASVFARAQTHGHPQQNRQQKAVMR